MQYSCVPATIRRAHVHDFGNKLQKTFVVCLHLAADVDACTVSESMHTKRNNKQ